jgi:hypothetical protein
MTTDLTSQEQAHVRTALRFLRIRCGGWAPLAKALGAAESTIANVVRGSDAVSARVAIRVARFAAVGVDDVLAGRFPPPGTCPLCGGNITKEEANDA